MSEKARELEFRRGYYLAVALIMRMHGAEQIAEDVLKEYGAVDLTGIDPYDVEVLRPLSDAIDRRRAAETARINRKLNLTA